MDPFSMLGLGAAQAGMGALSSIFGHRGKMKQRSTMTPGQVQSADWARTTGQQQIQNPYEGFQPIADRAQRMYQQQTVPSLMERFNAMGSGNALSSGALLAQLRGSGIDLSGDLAALQSQYGLQQQGLGQQLLNQGMRPQFENYYQEGGPSFMSGLMSSGSQMAGNALGMGMQRNYMRQQNDSMNDSSGVLGQILQMLRQRQ
jgi:hypothetical protein